MKILLIGERYSPNLGDGVIYDTVEYICKDIYKDVSFVCLDISGNNNFKTNNSLIGASVKLKLRFLRKIMSSFKRYMFIKRNINNIDFSDIDGAIFVGGQLFSEYFSRQIYIISKKLNKLNIPVIFNCCGLGKNDKLRNRNYISKSINFKNVKALSLRDNYDLFISQYKINNIKIELTMDPVLELSKYYNIKDKKNYIVGIGLMEPKLFSHNKINLDRDKYFQLVDNIVSILNECGIKYEFFCNGSLDDYNFINEFVMKYNYSIEKIANCPKKPIELINLVSKYNKIISFRLHSHIIANSYNIPSIGFCWDNKVTDYGKNINCDKYFLDLTNECIDNINDTINLFLFDNDKYNFIESSKLKLTSTFLSENKFLSRCKNEEKS